ncbi:MAG: alkaline phosphatase [Myxococcota bacterium]
MQTCWVPLVLSLVSLLLTAGRTGPARNAILFVGDGMGVPVVTAARMHARGPSGRLAMELPHVALVRTYSRDRLVSDSASTATAVLSGQKVRVGTLGMSPETYRACSSPTRLDGSPNPVHPCSEGSGPIPSLLELASAKGMVVGVVTTTRITHATPAALYAHSDERDSEEEIAVQLLGAGLSFVAGGGRRFFLSRAGGLLSRLKERLPGQRAAALAASRTDGRDLLAESAADGVTVVGTGPALREAVSRGDRPILALLADDHLPFELQRRAGGEKVPSLAELTELAIRSLRSHPGGYLLLVEGGRIDHALHVNLARLALEETMALDDAVARARELAGDGTLLLVTADHGHPLVISGYPLIDDPVIGLARRFEGEDRVDEDGDGKPDFARGLDGKGMTVLAFGNGPGHGDPTAPKPATAPREDPIALGDGILELAYAQESAVPLLFSTHEGSDVFAAAEGPGSDAVRGFLENTEIFEIIRRALGL